MKQGSIVVHNTISDSDHFPELEAYVDRVSALELARRSLLGAPVYTVISLIMLAGTPMLMDYGIWASLEAVLLIMLGGVRVWFALGFERRYDKIGERAVGQFSVLTALQSLTLGIMSAMIIWQYWATQQAILTIVLSAGCIAAGTSALSVRRSAHLIFLACVLAPFGIGVYLVAGLAQATLITGFLSLMALLVQDGGQAKKTHFQHLKEHYGEQLARRRLRLEIEAKQGFINDIGHDIRAPVNSIIGMTSLLLNEKLEPKSLEIAEAIQESSNTLLDLVENIPGSIKTGYTAKGQLGALDLKVCITNIMDLYTLEASEKGLTITTHLDDIPENVISGNQNQIEQVLVNLMDNAMKFTDKGSITLSASCENLNDGAVLIEFSLADTGIGIPVENRQSVFNPFGTEDAEDAEGGDKSVGGGLGLPLCKSLVELMGGKIWIEDNEGQNTVVKFTIREELDPSCIHEESVEARSVTSRNSKLRDQIAEFGNLSQVYPHEILVVDDDEIHRQIVCAQLKKMGYEADEAADGEEAIAAVMKGGYDLIFMDLRMPNMNGIESSRWIRERFSGSGNVRIIALTGDATIEAREQCIRAGMDNFVTKPVQMKDLEAILCHRGYDKDQQNKTYTQTADTGATH
jgi:signal transduction histidine kinase/ActR/RegA family two-component response regulator